MTNTTPPDISSAAPKRLTPQRSNGARTELSPRLEPVTSPETPRGVPPEVPWPAEGLEAVRVCPLCGHSERSLAYSDVKDWSFFSAPGSWTYWDCAHCRALYLDPRPTAATVGNAYKSYYTHAEAGSLSLLTRLKNRLRNEALSQQLGTHFEPRLPVLLRVSPLVAWLSRRVVVPFGWRELESLPRGRFLDVGCGSGQTVALAQRLGWQATGLEVDPLAVREARLGGLDIIEGTIERLSNFEGKLDCVMCSHVLEHVHQPLQLLALLHASLRPGGVLLLTLPNALSAVRRHFGVNWRGLEAPRHLCIPALPYLRQCVEAAGFAVESQCDARAETVSHSLRIRRRARTLTLWDIAQAQALDLHPADPQTDADFIKLVCWTTAGSAA